MLNCTYSHNPLALPLGELSLQATERAEDKSPPAERVNGIPHLALPLGELSAKLTERHDI